MAPDGSPNRRGRPTKLSDYRRFLFRVPTELYNALVIAAEKRSVSLNDLLILIVTEWVDRNRSSEAERDS